ncbi:DUF6816 family protein [Oxynema sp. CENA135]|uniref:DUF6816 family protein n=1 Tax=Oxynema sp. CENA135 TaxID=984206 RepID=UPI001F3CBD06|nr:hypothetical protein [Oxynema sp. CENA135]
MHLFMHFRSRRVSKGESPTNSIAARIRQPSAWVDLCQSWCQRLRRVAVLAIAIALLGTTAPALAGSLGDRVSRFPEWQSKPRLQLAKGDLVYPNWMEGTWEVTSTLLEQYAPLAPEIVTPGFEKNKRFLKKPVTFKVKFSPEESANRSNALPSIQNNQQVDESDDVTIVADREFNGLNLAKAYLGDRKVVSVKVDPDDPNRQITELSGNRTLVSVVTARGSEMPSDEEFMATEITQQVFRGDSSIYLNEVETTTDYRKLQPPVTAIEADQMTAIYLSPQDPDFFAAGGQPVALYHYKLELFPLEDNAKK